MNHKLKTIETVDGKSRWVCSCKRVGLFVPEVKDVMTSEEWAKGAFKFHVDNPEIGEDQ